MYNPLNKRLLRELRSDFGKYAVIFLLMVLSIGEVSGFLVADGSMLRAYEDSFEKYNIEDGHFTTSSKLNKAQRKDIEQLGVSIYDLFYREIALSNKSRLRVYPNRDQINKVCLMKGDFPKKSGEVCIDRMYAINNHLKIGDTLTSENGNLSWRVTGLVALSDYSALFENNSDSMFDSVKFGVAILYPDEFSTFKDRQLTYCYGWKYKMPPAAESEEKDLSEDFMKALNSLVKLETFVPRLENQAIVFTGNDMGSDRTMIQIFLYIIIVIIAFVFGVTISNTIVKEAEVIGTLRASGFTRRELTLHYMSMPVLVTLISAVIGNIFGYTIMKNFNASLYYGSYSLPTYVTIWSPTAFVETTLIPILLMLVITWFILHRRLALSPLKFLRKDLKKSSRGLILPLSNRIPFFTRFRIRIISQNIGSYLTMLIGILFANLLLMFGLLLPVVLNHYQKEITSNLLCPYQYILQVPASAMNEDRKLESFFNMLIYALDVETDYEKAEKFSCYTLNTIPAKFRKSEEIMLYGVEKNSRYIKIDSVKDQVFISSAYADKFELGVGDRIRLKEKYEDKFYTFRIGGIYDYIGGLAVFMDQKTLNETFDLGSDYFSGYFSDKELTDIDNRYVSTVIDQEALTKISRQLNVSFGSMMRLVDVFSVLIFIILIYLLSKIIIEKNASAISMTKILGYKDGEIGRLYILSSALITIFCFFFSLPVETMVMKVLLRIMMSTEMSGWIPFYMDPIVYVKMIALGLSTYALVAVFELRKIKQIPLEEALKNAE